MKCVFVLGFVACSVCFVFEFDKVGLARSFATGGCAFFFSLNNYFMLNSMQIDWYFMNSKMQEIKKIKCKNCVCEMCGVLIDSFSCVGCKRCENEIQTFHIDQMYVFWQISSRHSLSLWPYRCVFFSTFFPIAITINRSTNLPIWWYHWYYRRRFNAITALTKFHINYIGLFFSQFAKWKKNSSYEIEAFLAIKNH